MFSNCFVIAVPSKVGVRLAAFDYSGEWTTSESEIYKILSAEIKRDRELEDPKTQNAWEGGNRIAQCTHLENAFRASIPPPLLTNIWV